MTIAGQKSSFRSRISFVVVVISSIEYSSIKMISLFIKDLLSFSGVNRNFGE